MAPLTTQATGPLLVTRVSPFIAVAHVNPVFPVAPVNPITRATILPGDKAVGLAVGWGVCVFHLVL